MYLPYFNNIFFVTAQHDLRVLSFPNVLIGLPAAGRESRNGLQYNPGFPLTRLCEEGLPDCIVQAGTSAGRKSVGMTTFFPYQKYAE
jgi:hypothetical protein